VTARGGRDARRRRYLPQRKAARFVSAELNCHDYPQKRIAIDYDQGLNFKTSR
jgi:hypothetical protein